jgi:hypothetical protein
VAGVATPVSQAAVDAVVDALETQIQDAVNGLVELNSAVGYILKYDDTNHTLDVFIR